MDPQLNQALHTLHAIRRRYDEESAAASGYVRSRSVQVAFSYSDMLWITATISALEKAERLSALAGAESLPE